MKKSDKVMIKADKLVKNKTKSHQLSKKLHKLMIKNPQKVINW